MPGAPPAPYPGPACGIQLERPQVTFNVGVPGDVCQHSGVGGAQPSHKLHRSWVQFPIQGIVNFVITELERIHKYMSRATPKMCTHVARVTAKRAGP